MASTSKIEWTGKTWIFITGCTKCSRGCKRCYAELMSLRLKGIFLALLRLGRRVGGFAKYKNGFKLTLHPDCLEQPLQWKKPSLIFANSMSDTFHEAVPEGFIVQAFDVMERANWHQFQVLTKRAERLAEMSARLAWPPNVWMGVSVENEDNLYRLDLLQETGAAIKFLSAEPLVGPLPNMNLFGIGWVIVGGESGPGAAVCKVQWIRDIIRQCRAAGVPVFVKQLGSNSDLPDITKKGGDPAEWPRDVRVREFPEFDFTLTSR